jgi:large subunit ribosomal protein L13
MTKSNNNNISYTIDAKGRRLGRVASEAAALLMGKKTTGFHRSKPPTISVTITGCSGMEISDLKKKKMIYKKYSGYPGGLRLFTLGELISKKGVGEVVRLAVKGMLPKNKISRQMIKNLKVLD